MLNARISIESLILMILAISAIKAFNQLADRAEVQEPAGRDDLHVQRNTIQCREEAAEGFVRPARAAGTRAAYVLIGRGGASQSAADFAVQIDSIVEHALARFRRKVETAAGSLFYTERVEKGLHRAEIQAQHRLRRAQSGPPG